MNRPIKFRVWDNVDYMSSPFTLQDLQSKNIQFTSDCVVMQFTGLLDKNGNEIYEGDILEHVTDKNITRKKVVYDAQHGAFIMRCDKFFAELRATYCDGDMYASTYEIIGNIHQNPELLK